MKLAVLLIAAGFLTAVYGSNVQLAGSVGYFTDPVECNKAGNFWCSSSVEDGYCSEYGDCEEGYDYEPKLAAVPDIDGSQIDSQNRLLRLKMDFTSTHYITNVVMNLGDSDDVQGNCKFSGTTASCIFEKSFSLMPAAISPEFIADVDDYDSGPCEL